MKVGLLHKGSLFGKVGLGKGGGGVPFPPVIEDGNSVGWYIADELSTITKDGSDFMSEWRDYLGSGHDLLQAVGTSQPKWILNNGVLFDGIDNFMKTLAFTYNQPEQIYIVLKQVVWSSGNVLFDGNGAFSGALQNRPASPGMAVRSGIESPVNANLAVNTYGIIRVLFNGANSSFQINETTPLTGNYGTSAMNAFTIGSRGAAAQYTNIQVKEIILRKIADSPTDEQAIYDYLALKYSI